jgi:hypothetical protein
VIRQVQALQDTFLARFGRIRGAKTCLLGDDYNKLATARRFRQLPKMTAKELLQPRRQSSPKRSDPNHVLAMMPAPRHTKAARPCPNPLPCCLVVRVGLEDNSAAWNACFFLQQNENPLTKKRVFRGMKGLRRLITWSLCSARQALTNPAQEVLSSCKRFSFQSRLNFTSFQQISIPFLFAHHVVHGSLKDDWSLYRTGTFSHSSADAPNLLQFLVTSRLASQYPVA